MLLGHIHALWRYPVKSMQGESITQSLVDERGLLGDRAFAVVDRATGFVASAKHPQKWGRLLHCRAAYVGEPLPGQPPPAVRIELPDGTVVLSTDPEVDGVLSAYLQREVRLAGTAPPEAQREADRTPVDTDDAPQLIRQETMGRAAPAGTFFDYAPVHLISTASLRQVQLDHGGGPVALSRFRPNLFVQVEPEGGYVENGWLGHTCTLGALKLRMIDPSPRCVIITSPQGELPQDKQLLRTLARHNGVPSVTAAPGHVLPAVLGVYAQVAQGGTVRLGDALSAG